MRDYLLLILAWTGALLAFLGLASYWGTDAVGDHHHWWFASDLGLIAVGGGVAAAALAIWCATHAVWHRFVAWVVRTVGLKAAVDVPVDLAVSPIEPPPEFDILSTALLVIDTSRYSPRTVEKVTVGDGYYVRRVVREFVLPLDADPLPSKREDVLEHVPPQLAALLEHVPLADRLLARPERRETTFLLPVLRFARSRGSFHAPYLEVRQPDGQHVSTLNLGEYFGLIKRVVEVLTLSIADTSELTDDVKKSIDELLDYKQLVDLPPEGPSRAEVRAARRAREKKLEWIDDIHIPETRGDDADDWLEAKKRLWEFCEAILDAHIIFVPFVAAPGQRVVLEYEFTEPHKSRTHDVRDRIRYRLGLRPHQHQFSVTEHRWAQSYHLEFLAPQEQYVFRCDVRALTPRSASALAGSIAEFQPDGRQGSDYTHIYVREAPRDQFRERVELAVEIDCREKPPGMLGNVWVVALAEAILIWVVGLRLNALFGVPETGFLGTFLRDLFGGGESARVATDLPALLLAAPGLIVGLLGAQITGERLRVTSMATMVGLIACGLIAIFSTAIALSKSTGDVFGSNIGVDHPWWVLLMLLSAVLTADLFLRMLWRGSRFSSRINNPSRSLGRRI